MLQLVNKNQARRLKLLGFNLRVKDLYVIEHARLYMSERMDIDENWNKYDYTLSRPAVAEALQWMREVFDCKCEIIIPDWEEDDYRGGYCFPEMDQPFLSRVFTDRDKAESELLTRILEYQITRKPL